MAHKNNTILLGQKFGRLTVLDRDKSNNTKHAYWICQCECGKIKSIRSAHLRSGGTISCGCYSAEMAAKRKTTHNLYGNRIYRIWANMIQRCKNPHEKCYKNYGGRGISVCQEWVENFLSFHSYVISLVDSDNEKMTLDRIDNDGNYEPGNVRWATRKQQGRNTRTVKMVTYKGKTQCLLDWSLELSLDKGTIRERLKRGMTIEQALEKPGNRKNVR